MPDYSRSYKGYLISYYAKTGVWAITKAIPSKFFDRFVNIAHCSTESGCIEYIDRMYEYGIEAAPLDTRSTIKAKRRFPNDRQQIKRSPPKSGAEVQAEGEADHHRAAPHGSGNVGTHPEPA